MYAQPRRSEHRREIKDAYARTFDYIGELDEDGKACGRGIATSRAYPREQYTGTFFNDLYEGIGIFTSSEYGSRYEGEFKAGEKFGKVTAYNNDGKICNYFTSENGTKVEELEYVTQENTFYKDGKPKKHTY